MTFDEQEILQRFHRALVRELHAKNPEHIHAPFSVAEIYQNLVPYRTHRNEIGVEMNADYEHALLRLLAGEGDYLTIESRTARDEIRAELDSPNPNTGLYRDFAAADVRLNPDRLDEALMGEIGLSAPGGAVASQEFSESFASAGARLSEGVEQELEPEEEFERLEVEPLGAALGPIDEEDASDELQSGAPEEMEAPEEIEDSGGEETLEESREPVEEKEDLPPFENCPWCREELPQQARVRFCPFCGSNVRMVPCPACGEELRLNWRFCIACGTEVES